MGTCREMGKAAVIAVSRSPCLRIGNTGSQNLSVSEVTKQELIP